MIPKKLFLKPLPPYKIFQDFVRENNFLRLALSADRETFGVKTKKIIRVQITFFLTCSMLDFVIENV